MMDQKLCDTPLTGEYLARHMKESLSPRAILKSIDGHRIAEGQGYASNILQLNLTWEKADDLPSSVVVKVPNIESLQKLMETITAAAGHDDHEKVKAIMAKAIPIVHNAECEFYRMFGKVPPIPLPVCYAAIPVTDKAPGMIVLEDLSGKASISHDLLNGLTYKQTMEAISALARLHAWSLKTSLDWRTKVASLKDREEMMRGFMSATSVGFQMAKEKYPTHFGSINVDHLVELSKYEKFERIMSEHTEFMVDVMCHGDYHINNIMFDKNKDGIIGDRLVAVIDFQALMKGCPMYDLAHLFSFSVSSQLRRKHQNDFLRRYYDEAKLIAGDKLTASFEQLQRLFDRQFAIAAILMLSWIPTLQTVLVKSDGAQKEKDELKVLETIKAGYEDAMKTFGQ